MVQIIDADPDLHTLADVAAQLKVSPRTLQRIALRYVGLPPAELIRRRRLQEAAERVRADPATSLAQVAAELGYADQAHLTREFRDRLGFTPGDYRSQVGTPSAGHGAVASAD
jgi:AraC-like DNA-binding protein